MAGLTVPQRAAPKPPEQRQPRPPHGQLPSAASLLFPRRQLCRDRKQPWKLRCQQPVTANHLEPLHLQRAAQRTNLGARLASPCCQTGAPGTASGNLGSGNTNSLPSPGDKGQGAPSIPRKMGPFVPPSCSFALGQEGFHSSLP